MNARISGLLACVLFVGGAHGTELDFKGVVIGQPTTPQAVQDRLQVKCGAGAPGMQVCNGNVTVAGVPASMNLVIGAGGRVQRISLDFPADRFLAVEEAMEQKFGAPGNVDNHAVQNGMGATFQQTVETWGVAPAPVATLSRYGSTVTRGSLVFRSEEDRVLLRKIYGGDPSDI